MAASEPKAGDALTVAAAVAEAAGRLEAAGCDAPRRDAEVLLRHVAGWDEVRLVLAANEPLDAAVAARFRLAVGRRAAREPIAYVTGEREFYSRRFAVDRRVLVPRPETEHVVEVALQALAGRRPPLRIVDVGTGSGVIAVTLALELHERGFDRGVEIVALDRSPGALELARANGRSLAGVRAPLRWLRGDLMRALAPGRADLVVANPPYLSAGELERAPAELRFEPREALEGGDPDGLGVVRSVLVDARRVLRPGGELVSEIGCEQGAKVASLAAELGWAEVRIARDLAGRDRVLRARSPGPPVLRSSRGEDGWTRSSFAGGAGSPGR